MIEYSATIGRIADRLTTSQYIHLMPANTEFAPVDGWDDVVQRLPLGSSHVLYVFDMQFWPKSMWPGAPTPGGLIQGDDDGPDPDCTIEDYFSKNPFSKAGAWRSYGNCMSEQAVEQCGREVDAEFSTHFAFDDEDDDDEDTYHWDVHGHVSCNEEVD